MSKKKNEEIEETSTDPVAAAEPVADETAEIAAAPKKKPAAKKAEKKEAKPKARAKSTGSGDANVSTVVHKRAEKIGVVASDKMTKTVTVRVDRLVKHPIYRKYVKKRKKFMAHDDLGAKVGDKVKIVETRPLSARKRWRVVEIIQKAEL